MDGSKTYDWSNSAIAAIASILLVFVVLIIIIGITHLIFKLLGYFELKKQLDESKNQNEAPKEAHEEVTLDLNDEDMVVAVLVATIDYRNECKQDVKLVSVKEIK